MSLENPLEGNYPGDTPRPHVVEGGNTRYLSPLEHLLFCYSTTIYPLDEILNTVKRYCESGSKNNELLRKLITVLTVNEDDTSTYHAEEQDPESIWINRHQGFVQGIIPLFDMRALGRGLAPRVYFSPLEDPLREPGKIIPNWRVTVVRTRDENGPIAKESQQEVPEALPLLRFSDSSRVAPFMELYPQDEDAGENFRLLEIKGWEPS